MALEALVVLEVPVDLVDPEVLAAPAVRLVPLAVGLADLAAIPSAAPLKRASRQ